MDLLGVWNNMTHVNITAEGFLERILGNPYCTNPMVRPLPCIKDIVNRQNGISCTTTCPECNASGPVDGCITFIQLNCLNRIACFMVVDNNLPNAVKRPAAATDTVYESKEVLGTIE